MSLEPSLLIVTIDIDSFINGINGIKSRNPESPISVASVMGNIVIFLNSYSLMHRENKLCVISYHTNGVDFLYPDLNTMLDQDVDFSPSQQELHSRIAVNMKKSIDSSQSTAKIRLKSRLNSAFSSALTIVNNEQLKKRYQSRILNIQFDKDSSQDYNSIMNSIFRYSRKKN
jgi:hypothetical protein